MQNICSHKRNIVKNSGVIILLLMLTYSGQSQNILMNPDSTLIKTKIFIPFPFYNQVLKVAVALSYSENGNVQDQASNNVLVSASTTGSLIYSIITQNYRLPFSQRLFLSSELNGGKIKKFVNYAGFNNPDNPDERGGSNESDVDNNITAESVESHFYFYFKYLLPIGYGKENTMAKIVLENGFPVSKPVGGYKWNPFVSGRTYIEVSPYFSTTHPNLGSSFSSTGAGLSLIYDNTDFSTNPQKGSFQKLDYIRAPSISDYVPFSLWSFEYSKYMSLGLGKNSRQSTLVLSFQTKYSPSWDKAHETDSDGQSVIYQRPQNFKRGTTLGGLFRFRGYDLNRFSDQSLLYYGVEYRHVPGFKSPKYLKLLGKDLKIDWIQFVLFGEFGRVAPEWNFDTFHKKMKWDAGLGVRTFVNSILIRMDWAYSNEGALVQMNVNHPF